MNSDNILSRFLSAQQSIYPQVVKELQAGKKTSHWMWFIFPQINGLAQSSTAKHYSIKNIKEAKEFIEHPVLGKRLLECANILININNKTADDIFGYPDNLKLKSCITLFNYIASNQKVFAEVLQKYFAGDHDEKTLSILQKLSS
jgi:uncharacterized protein (DUF1810 family)